MEQPELCVCLCFQYDALVWLDDTDAPPDVLIGAVHKWTNARRVPVSLSAPL